MHHFIYPTQDTFITNIDGYEDLNFGLNEVLRVGAQNLPTKITEQTKEYNVSSSVSNYCVLGFSGSIVDATLSGSVSTFIGGPSSSYFSGSLSGSGISGSVYDFSGKIIWGYIYGTQTINQQNVVIGSNIFKDRALLQFDLSAISQSVVSGDINLGSASFFLKMKTARAEELPIQYSLYAYPLYESWVMGNGYFYDGGSTLGASWLYRDKQNGTGWTYTGSTYLTFPSASQNFSYEASDVSMDVTDIVKAWLSGSVTNNGLVIISSEETDLTGSGMALYFFSEDTNTIYSPYIDAGWEDVSTGGGGIGGFITGSVSTGSVTISTTTTGFFATASDSPSISGISISGSIFGVMDVVEGDSGSISGSISGQGSSGNITGIPIFGGITGSITEVTGFLKTYWPGCGGGKFEISPWDYNLFIANYGYFPFVTTTSTTNTPVTYSILTAALINGNFSGSIITASITNDVQFQGTIVGSWNGQILSGSTYLSASYPFLNYPTLLVSITGDFIRGTGFGSLLGLTSYSGSEYGIFSGSIIDGLFIGAKVVIPFTGSLFTSSYSYTSSVVMVSSSLSPLSVSSPFITVVKIPEKVKTNEIIKVKVFGKEQFPLKNFQRLPQFSQFLTPLYLPYSSFYAIKDNETEEIILDFDNYTRLSCDTNGSYFMLDTSGLPEERYVKILIKIEQSGSVYVIDNNDIFKVVR